MIPDFYTSHPEWPGGVEHIVELLGRVAATEELSGRTLELRRTRRLGAVPPYGIEGNELTLSQVAEVATVSRCWHPTGSARGRRRPRRLRA